MPRAKSGDTVKVHYTGKLADGTVFDSSADRDPLQFTLGRGQVIPGFEKAVLGLQAGESTTATIPADEAYGQRQDEMIMDLDRSHFPNDLKPEVGQLLQIRQEEGEAIEVKVTNLSGEKVTVDANHPLAGEDLTFDIHLVAIV